MRSIWKGSIGFGLVNIPVSLYAATEESNLPFVTLDKSNHARVRCRKVNESTGRDVKETDVVKGYKTGSGYVIMEEEDFSKATPEKQDHLEITQFLYEKEIDALYYEKAYYLEPAKSGTRAYNLLRDALKKEGKAALGPLVYHKREWICLIKPHDTVLMLHRLRFSQEIRGAEGLAISQTTVSSEELKMAASLIHQFTKPFNPEVFRDEYSQKLLKVIEQKSKGKSVRASAMKVVHSSTENLMEKLKASLKNSSKKAS